MNKKIGVLGSGAVGQTLSKGLRKLGFEVAIGSRDGHAVEGWNGGTGTFQEVAEQSDIIVLSVKGSAAEELVKSIKPHLAGKTVIDTTNPIADEPPVDGVLNFFTSLNDSLLERLQQHAPDAHFIKAFNSVGSAMMVKPEFKGDIPTMFVCGNNAAAKEEVTTIVHTLGWDVADMGSAQAARAIEPLCILWCIPGMLNNEWTHAFKLLKQSA
jgi:predicted dinucleotide-binding enzyme